MIYSNNLGQKGEASSDLLIQCDHACMQALYHLQGELGCEHWPNPTYCQVWKHERQSHTASWLYHMQTSAPFNAALVGSSRPDHHSHYTSCESDCRISSVWTSVGLPFFLCSWSRDASHLLATVWLKANSTTLWRSSLLNSCSQTRRLRTAERQWRVFNYIASNIYKYIIENTHH